MAQRVSGAALIGTLRRQCRQEIETDFEVDLSDWQWTIYLHCGTAQVTFENPRTGAEFDVFNIYYDDDGKVMHSERAIR